MKINKNVIMTYNLFVYGTLRRGFHNHDLMRNAKHICDGKTMDNMRLVVNRFHGIPFTWKDKCGNPLRGELYEINYTNLTTIHSMEVHSGYEAEWMPIVLDNGENARAMVYLYPPITITSRSKMYQDVVNCDYSIFRLK